MEEAVAQLSLQDAPMDSHQHDEGSDEPRPLPAAARPLESRLGVPHAPRARASYSSPLIDACEEMAQALIDSPYLKMPAREEGMGFINWAQAVFELHKDAPFVDKIEFEKAKISPGVQQLEFLYRKLVDPSGHPDFRDGVFLWNPTRYGDEKNTPKAPRKHGHLGRYGHLGR